MKVNVIYEKTNQEQGLGTGLVLSRWQSEIMLLVYEGAEAIKHVTSELYAPYVEDPKEKTNVREWMNERSGTCDNIAWSSARSAVVSTLQATRDMCE